MTLQSANVQLDSACSLLSSDHYVTRELGVFLEDVEWYIEDADPGCDVVVGAAGCGGCVAENVDYAVFYLAQDPRTVDTLYLNYDTGEDYPGRDPALSRRELGMVVARAAEETGLDWSWSGSVSDRVVVGEGADPDDGLTADDL